MSPDNAEAHNTLGVTLREQGNIEEGTSALRRALDLRPAYAEARHNLANALREQGECQAAAEEFRRALGFNADDAQARLGLAVASIPILAGDVAESANACERFSRALDELSAWSHAHPG
ncbi:MAG TPA: tetratricopeptide repeat protein, partial [Steroidobacteraceae bacterium]|nr:tetratricopeptide repeat protein [Steroidobacteraceae bacterium]